MANLLIIDDDLDSAGAMAALLRREGHDTSCVGSAGAALSFLRENEPDLVLLDLTLPHVEGLDLLRALSDEPRFSHLRVAVYSARDEAQSLKQAWESGACDYIVKGASWPDTYQRIRSCLEGNGDPMPAPQA